ALARHELEHCLQPEPEQEYPQQSAELEGIAAISANDIWAVGVTSSGTLTEHWDGKNWKIVASPSPGQNNQLLGVTALSDSTVAAVGSQVSSTTGTIPLILQNAESAPRTRAATTNMPLSVQSASIAPAGSTSTAQTKLMPEVLDPTPVDQSFVTAGKVDG